MLMPPAFVSLHRIRVVTHRCVPEKDVLPLDSISIEDSVQELSGNSDEDFLSRDLISTRRLANERQSWSPPGTSFTRYGRATIPRNARETTRYHSSTVTERATF